MDYHKDNGPREEKEGKASEISGRIRCIRDTTEGTEVFFNQ